MKTIGFITPGNPGHEILKHRDNVKIVSPQQIGAIIPSVLKRIQTKPFNRGLNPCGSKKKNKRR